MTTARRHHYVPQFYLRGFSLPRKKVPQVEVFDRNRWAPFQSPIANIAAERDFNRIDVEGLDPNAFEEAIARIESKFALALQRIIAARSLRDEDDRAMLLNLIALLFLRNPRRRELKPPILSAALPMKLRRRRSNRTLSRRRRSS